MAEEPGEPLTAADLAGFCRELAAISHPRYERIHRAVGDERIRAGARVAQQILNAHLELRQRMGRNARTGRRKHSQTVYELLDGTNDVDLQLAVAVLSLPFVWGEDRSAS
jgi:hypothetical protein